MANMCSCQTVIVGPKTDLLNLKNLIDRDGLPTKLGYLLDRPSLFEEHLRVDYETKWSNTIWEWEQFLSEKFPYVKAFHFVEGEEYINTDRAGRYHQVRFYIDAELDDGRSISNDGLQYQNSWDDVLNAINRWLGKSFGTYEEAFDYVHKNGRMAIHEYADHA